MDYVKQYERLVGKIARQYVRKGVDVQDLEQAAWLRLAEAMPKFDGRCPEAAYAAQHIRWAVVEELGAHGYKVRKRQTSRAEPNQLIPYDEGALYRSSSGCTVPRRADSDAIIDSNLESPGMREDSPDNCILVFELLERLTYDERDFIWRYIVQDRSKFTGKSNFYESRRSRDILAKMKRSA